MICLRYTNIHGEGNTMTIVYHPALDGSITDHRRSCDEITITEGIEMLTYRDYGTKPFRESGCLPAVIPFKWIDYQEWKFLKSF